MQGLMQKICLGLTLSCLVGTIAACNGTSVTEDSASSETDTTEESTPSSETATESQTAEPNETPAQSETAPSTSGSTAAQPTTTPVPPLPAECSNPQTQTDMNACAKAEYEQADARLNNAYQDVQSSVSGQRADQLVSAEQAWLEFRDAYCDYVQEQFAGGSIQPTVYYGCLTQLTRDRTAELQQAKQASMSYEAADQELNSVYQDLQGYLSAEDQELLTDAQIAWLDYRDFHCTFEEGDTNTCLAEITETRVKQLKEQLDTRSL